MVLAEGTRRKLPASAFSARHRRPAHSETTRKQPRKPCGSEPLFHAESQAGSISLRSWTTSHAISSLEALHDDEGWRRHGNAEPGAASIKARPGSCRSSASIAVRQRAVLHLSRAGGMADERNIGHVRGAPCHPQIQGKIERWHQMLKKPYPAGELLFSR
jgi:hypothetical protein